MHFLQCLAICPSAVSGDARLNSVFVYDDKLVLTYNYKDGTETLTLQEIESV